MKNIILAFFYSMISSIESMELFSCGLIHDVIFVFTKGVGLYNDDVYTQMSLYVAVYDMHKA